MKRTLLAFAAAAAVAVALAPSTPVEAKEYGKCGFDSDCHAGVKCRSGKCADSAGSSCAFDSDCGGSKCRSGKCAIAPDGSCAFDSDCGPRGKCSSSKCR